MDPAPFSKEILKTGFVLENQVAQKLKAANWKVISNKYYVDDSKETVREIDLVAYRVTKVQHFTVYTVLIISCKKNEENAWALLARDIDLNDPNAEWWPLHTWSNDKALQYKLAETGKPRLYHEQLKVLGVTEALSTPAVEVFAFQEMNKVSGKPQNDKPIFDAVTSLIKAQAYELSALPARKKAPTIYQFNLVSVVDAELIRLMFRKNEITCSPLDSEHYLARYIVHKRETFSRIRFVKAEAFSSTLQDYSRLHEANCQWFSSECDSFYSGIMRNWERADVLAEDFKKQIQWPTVWLLERKFGQEIDIGSPSFIWDESEDTVGIGISARADVISFMNEDAKIIERTTKALKTVFRYVGKFKFTDEIPF
ncbi:MAG: hypothetical protein PHS14_13360 [Elusimicrobia bacterium]|nr:hypothetical protein [Elusimicrobiota bacterium]